MQVLCYDYAISYLSRYPKTSYELGLQLQKKGYTQEEIDVTKTKLETIGFLDDRLYADMYLRSEVARKGKPLFVVIQKLRKKGVDQEILDDLVDDLEEDLSVGQRKKIAKEIDRWEEKGLDQQRINQRLQSRGYDYRDIQDVYTKDKDVL